jgi:hypothetical protein
MMHLSAYYEDSIIYTKVLNRIDTFCMINELIKFTKYWHKDLTKLRFSINLVES